MQRSNAHDTLVRRRRRRAVGGLALAPLAAIAVGSTVAQFVPASFLGGAEAVVTHSRPAASATATPTPTPTQDPVALPTDGPEVASPVHGIAATSSPARTASYAAIPGPALAAYQRAAAVIDSSSPACHLSWTLLGGIGQVESNHGQVSAGARTSSTRIIGIRLDGKHGTRAVPDTDGGTLDGDTKWDRAVGPMQFLPSTWRAVGVDADGDGKRDPQDIDDAALAAAVYLCGSGQDLATEQGQEKALHTYDHSASYVASVMRVAASYAEGEQASVPAVSVVTGNGGSGGSTSSATFVPKHRKPKHAHLAGSVGFSTGIHAATPTAPVPAVATAPPVDAATLAAQTCLDRGLVDVPTVANDPYDICVAQLLGLPTPVPTPDPTPTPGPTPAPDPTAPSTPGT